MGNNKVTPEIRFKDFNDPWEQRKFTEIVDRVKTSSNSNLLPKVEFEDIKAGEGRLNKDVSHKFDTRKGILFKPNNILFGKLRPYLKNWLLPDFEGIALGDFWVFKPKNSDAYFTYYLIQASKYQKVANDTSGTKMPRSDWKLVSTTSFSIPCFEEQMKIGSFLKRLDNTIALHQHELSLLKQRKKAFLQKMFPKKGNNKPSVRFQNFKEEWEHKKLRDLGITKSGTGFPEKAQGGTQGVPFYKISDMNTCGNEREMRISNNYVTDEQIKKNRWSPINKVPAIIFAKVGAAIMLNRKRLVTHKFMIDNNTMAFLFDKNLDINFAIALFEKIFLPRYAQVGALPSYNSSDIETIDIIVPSLEEQIKIGNFFKQLDEDITLHEQKLEKLKLMKKAFLQKMFV